MLNGAAMKNIGSIPFNGISRGSAEDCRPYYGHNRAYIFYRGTLGFPGYGKTHCDNPTQDSDHASDGCVDGLDPSWVP